MHDGTQDIKPKPVSELTPSREEAERRARAVVQVAYLVELAELADITFITVGVVEMRAVLSYVEWLVAERKETLDALAAMGGAE